MIEELYPNFLDLGYTPSLFWDSTLQEIFDLMESAYRKQELEEKKRELDLKTKIVLNSILARQIGEYVSSLFNKDTKISTPEDLFPSLFKTEKELLDEKKKLKELELNKARMKDFALRHNLSFKRKEE